MRAGARCPDGGLLVVLLDDAELLGVELRKDPSLLHHRVDVRCAFTPLLGATLLHVAAEFSAIVESRGWLYRSAGKVTPDQQLRDAW